MKENVLGRSAGNPFLYDSPDLFFRKDRAAGRGGLGIAGITLIVIAYNRTCGGIDFELIFLLSVCTELDFVHGNVIFVIPFYLHPFGIGLRNTRMSQGNVQSCGFIKDSR